MKHPVRNVETSLRMDSVTVYAVAGFVLFFQLFLLVAVFSPRQLSGVKYTERGKVNDWTAVIVTVSLFVIAILVGIYYDIGHGLVSTLAALIPFVFIFATSLSFDPSPSDSWSVILSTIATGLSIVFLYTTTYKASAAIHPTLANRIRTPTNARVFPTLRNDPTTLVHTRENDPHALYYRTQGPWAGRYIVY